MYGREHKRLNELYKLYKSYYTASFVDQYLANGSLSNLFFDFVWNVLDDYYAEIDSSINSEICFIQML